jgi:hypothetical protein
MLVGMGPKVDADTTAPWLPFSPSEESGRRPPSEADGES